MLARYLPAKAHVRAIGRGLDAAQYPPRLAPRRAAGALWMSDNDRE